MVAKAGLFGAAFALLLCGCAGRSSVDVAAPVTTLTARVLATTEISTSVGDVAEVAYSHTLESADSPGNMIVAVALVRCPIANDRKQLYALTLERRPIAIGLQANQSGSLASNLVIVSCKAVPSSDVAHSDAFASRPPAPPALIDLDSEAARRALADQWARERQQALEAGPSVTRRFVIGWEMHHGYYFLPIDNTDDRVTPDFLDQRVRDNFDAQMRQDALALHAGERLQCECRGIAWDFYSDQRFIVQTANLAWVK